MTQMSNSSEEPRKILLLNRFCGASGVDIGVIIDTTYVNVVLIITSILNLMKAGEHSGRNLVITTKMRRIHCM